jgi:hypothetical protein
MPTPTALERFRVTDIPEKTRHERKTQRELTRATVGYKFTFLLFIYKSFTSYTLSEPIITHLTTLRPTSSPSSGAETKPYFDPSRRLKVH